MTKLPTRVLAGVLTAILAVGAGAVVALGGPAAADAAPLPWRTGAAVDPDAVDQLTFYDAAGHAVTGGNIHDAPFAAFVSGSAALRAGDGLATLFAFTPRPDVAPGAFTGLQVSAPTDVAAATLPAALDNGDPVVALDGADTTLAQYVGGNENTSSATGYAGVYELRLRTSAPGRGLTSQYAVADIVIEGSTWRVSGVDGGVATATSLDVTPADLTVGDTATLTATVTPSDTPGTVQFKDGATALGAPVAVASGSAAKTTVVTKAGSHAYSAVFTPTDATTFGGSTGNANVSVAKTTSSTTATWPAKATYGTAASVKVTVSATADGVTPTGTVTIKRGSTTVGSGTLSGGTATIKLGATSLPPGTASLVATYAGSDDVTGSSSTVGSAKVAKATAKVSQKLAAAKVKATAKARLTVTVTATGTVPAGTVTIFDGSRKIAAGTLKGGKVVVTLPKLQKGTHKLHATYAGSTLVLSATGAVVSLKVTS